LEQSGHRVDLLLTDVVLPGLNGRELYEAHAKRCCCGRAQAHLAWRRSAEQCRLSWRRPVARG
jgi:hypothetical protein